MKKPHRDQTTFDFRDTQLQAWDDIQASLPSRRRKVLEVIIKRRRIALFQIATHLHWPVNSVSGRVTELAQAGLIRDSGERVVNPETGKRGILWEINKK